MADLADDAVFRAVVDVFTPGDPEADYLPRREDRLATYVFGPYRTPGAARASVTREATLATWERNTYGMTAAGHIERASLDWQPVP